MGEGQTGRSRLAVEGNIQWGLNKTVKGWMLWLMNNKGVTKFLEEPEDLDPKAAAHVKVTYRVLCAIRRGRCRNDGAMRS